jgi:uncharacterized protein
MGYRNRRRLQIYAHARLEQLDCNPPLAGRLALPTYNSKVVQVVRLRLEAVDWNCPQHIKPLHRSEAGASVRLGEATY